MKDLIHRRLVENKPIVDSWWQSKHQKLDFPIYTSVDIRDAGKKIASVDANIFPAGFNNICDVDLESAPKLLKSYLDSHYHQENLNILLLTEEHTSNKYYWENVSTLKTLFESAGANLRIAVPKEFSGSVDISTPRGTVLKVFSAAREGRGVKISDGFIPNLIVSNNDFSNPYESWYHGLDLPMNPSHELGWFRRKKSDHFLFYNQVAEELCHILDIDPWTLTIKTQVVEVDFNSVGSVESLAQKVQIFLDQAKSHTQNPVAFVKNNRGTYGMGIISVSSGEEILKLSSKERKKMGYSKGGADVHEVIIQEGIPTEVQSEGDTAEPVIYLIGCQLAGGFLRTHKEKGPTENLNSPGAVFKRLCMSDLIVDVEGTPLENVYGTIARLNGLAIGLEAQAIGVIHRL